MVPIIPQNTLPDLVRGIDNDRTINFGLQLSADYQDRVNIGCGQAPTEAWRNFDNSLSVKLAKNSRVTQFASACRLLGGKTNMHLLSLRTDIT